MTFQEWLERTLELQRTTYKTNPPALEGEARAEYVRWNVLAAIDELTEFLDDFGWKPWAVNQGEIKDRPHAIEEIVDVMHFIANLLCVLDTSGDELDVIYRHKMAVNAARQQTGSYTG